MSIQAKVAAAGIDPAHAEQTAHLVVEDAASSGTPELRDAIRDARAKAIPWLVILTLLAKGLQFLLDYLGKQAPPAPMPAPQKAP